MPMMRIPHADEARCSRRPVKAMPEPTQARPRCPVRSGHLSPMVRASGPSPMAPARHLRLVPCSHDFKVRVVVKLLPKGGGC